MSSRPSRSRPHLRRRVGAVRSAGSVARGGSTAVERGGDGSGPRRRWRWRRAAIVVVRSNLSHVFLVSCGSCTVLHRREPSTGAAVAAAAATSAVPVTAIAVDAASASTAAAATSSSALAGTRHAAVAPMPSSGGRPWRRSSRRCHGTPPPTPRALGVAMVGERQCTDSCPVHSTTIARRADRPVTMLAGYGATYPTYVSKIGGMDSVGF